MVNAKCASRAMRAGFAPSRHLLLLQLLELLPGCVHAIQCQLGGQYRAKDWHGEWNRLQIDHWDEGSNTFWVHWLAGPSVDVCGSPVSSFFGQDFQQNAKYCRYLPSSIVDGRGNICTNGATGRQSNGWEPKIDHSSTKIDPTFILVVVVGSLMTVLALMCCGQQFCASGGNGSEFSDDGCQSSSRRNKSMSGSFSPSASFRKTSPEPHSLYDQARASEARMPQPMVV